MRYAIVRDGIVQNLAEWDGASEWGDAPSAVALDDGADVQISDTYDGKTFTPGPRIQPEPEPSIEELAARVDELADKVAVALPVEAVTP